MSDVTDHTDISLIEAFEAWPTKFDPALLTLAMSLKEQVVERIKQRLQTTMIQAHGSQHRPTQPNSSSSPPPERSAASADKTGSLGALPILRKRPSDEDDDGTSGGGNGDDKDRRKRQYISARADLVARLRKFSCPFHKMYPGSGKLYKSCKVPGWSSVHRVKEHIYRRHRRPAFRCPRCLETFETDDNSTNTQDLTQYVTRKMHLLRKRPFTSASPRNQCSERKKRERSEEERWFNIFNILFPEVPVDQRPSPYHESSLQVPAYDPAVFSEFRTFLLDALPASINIAVNNHLLVQPRGFAIPFDMTEIIRTTMQEVMDEHRPVLAPGSPDAEAEHRLIQEQPREQFEALGQA
ncbi:hypothetical protein B0T18DRAFT_202369 [Schizothecium vesticola]|uniref:C2H2-type domain-containing protein n=1 Tax=Schizothecium vesticola TaxID=314040 RepID=A0AA40BTG9_9PEZI|nr:hypothetical protein B0T18DRAFT_202369 [Schizothecium vesticola]